MSLLMQQLTAQNITDYKIWPAIMDTPRCKGISRAHKQIIQSAKENGLPEVLVFEDDIKFEAAGAFDYYMQNKPEDFDIYLGGIYRGEILDKRVKTFTGFHCYIVRQRFYDTFLGVDETRDIDHALSRLGDYHVCYPFAAIQHTGIYSDNNGAVSHLEPLLRNRLIYGRDFVN